MELLLLANFVMLVLIYLQLRKNIKETDRYFAAIDLSLRQFLANVSNTQAKNDRKKHDEILRQLDKISTNSCATARILKDAYQPKSVEDEYYESEQHTKWLAKAKVAKEKSQI